MIRRVPFILKLSLQQHRILVNKKPWRGDMWKGNDVKAIKDSIRLQLRAVQNRCAYCGLPFKGEKDIQIEHIAPKAESRHPQYTFTLHNLVLSCGYCNDLIVKGTKETIEGRAQRLYKKNSFLIVHPYFDYPEQHYEWIEEDCQVIIKAKDNNPKAIHSITMFELNSIMMSEMRAAFQLLESKKNRNIPQDENLIQSALTYNLS